MQAENRAQDAREYVDSIRKTAHLTRWEDKEFSKRGRPSKTLQKEYVIFSIYISFQDIHTAHTHTHKHIYIQRRKTVRKGKEHRGQRKTFQTEITVR